MIVQNIKIARARTGDIIVTVSDITNWTGLLAALYIATDTDSTVLISLTGTIDTVANTITFSYVKEETALLTANRYLYEVVLYDQTLTIVKTTTRGVVIVEPILQLTPVVEN